MLAALTFAVVISQASPNLGLLTPEQRTQYNRVTSQEFCSCDSPMTIAGCLSHKPACVTAKHLAQAAYKSAASGTSADQTLATLAAQVVGPMCGKAKTIAIPANAPALGPVKAPITMIEFADFRCSHCRHASADIKAAVARMGQQVHFVFVPFPLADHPSSAIAAVASLAAAKQGKFQPMHDALMTSLPDFTRDGVVAMARSLKLDIKRFVADLDGEPMRTLAQQLKSEGVKAGVMSTPAIFINGRPYALHNDLVPLHARLDMELERSKGSCK